MQNDLPCPWAGIPRRAWFAALSAGCFGIVAVGMALQHMLSLSPCPLCIFQRLLYLLVGSMALLGALMPAMASLWSLGVLALAGGGMAVSIYQTWMQMYPLLAPTCNFSDPNLIEQLVNWLGTNFPGWFLATGLCTSREWEFLGLSMANWSFFLFAGIFAYAYLLYRAGRD